MVRGNVLPLKPWLLTAAHVLSRGRKTHSEQRATCAYNALHMRYNWLVTVMVRGEYTFPRIQRSPGRISSLVDGYDVSGFELTISKRGESFSAAATICLNEVFLCLAAF